MSHFSVIVCTDSPDKIETVLAPYDENLEVEPYRDYEAGEPAKFWAVDVLREKAGLNPDDATLTWQQVADAHNKRYATEGEDPLLIDGARAYRMSTRNPDAKWDWWSEGGQWAGYFVARKGARDRVLAPRRNHRSQDVIMPGRCDGGRKGDLDLDALREVKADEARKLYAEWTALVEGTPEALPWASFRELLDSLPGYTIDRAREEYHSQPRVQAISGTDFRWHDDAIGQFSVPEPLYVERERARAVPGYATITLDGKWMAPGRMGWFGMSTDGDSERIGYWEAANAYIDALPDDAWLIAVDCHI